MKLEINHQLFDLEASLVHSSLKVECLESLNNHQDFTFLIQGKVFHIAVLASEPIIGQYTLEVNGKVVSVSVKSKLALLLEEMGLNKKEEEVGADIYAPMPGKILDVKVKVGDEMKKGDTLLVLEAMKMQNAIKSVSTGKVSKIHVQVDDRVEKGALLVDIISSVSIEIP